MSKYTTDSAVLSVLAAEGQGPSVPLTMAGHC